jgi:hypothetical protein
VRPAVARTAEPSATVAEVAEAPTPVAAPLDASGTRRAERVTIAKGVDVLVDGNTATLVDLSTCGAQVLSPTVLKPNQRVRITLSDDHGTWRVSGTITWASFEIPPRYRAGVEFLDADSAAIHAYTIRHKA